MHVLLAYLAVGLVNVAGLAVSRIRRGQWADRSAMSLNVVEVVFWLLAWPVQLAWFLAFRVVGGFLGWAGEKLFG